MLDWRRKNSRSALTLVCLLLGLTWTESKVLRGNESPGSECEIENGVMGRCETVTSCLEFGGVANRNGTMKMCSSAAGEEYVCCRRPFQVAEQLCGYWKSYWRDNNGKCIHSEPMIVGGIEALEGQFPEIGVLGHQINLTTEWTCGSTLLTPYFALTAAHCILDINDYVIRFGDHHLFMPSKPATSSRVTGPIPRGIYGENELFHETRNEVPTKQMVRVAQLIVHPEYDGRYNDLALLRLEKPVVMNKRVLPACLPTDPTETYLGKRLTAAGWGRLTYGGEISMTLQKVSIPAIDRLTCWEEMEQLNARLIPKGITEELLCAGEPGKDTCSGDSGGPLLVQETNGPCEHSVAGVTSFGHGCGRFGMYGRVSSYIDWITGYIAPGTTPQKPHSKLDSESVDPIFFPAS